MKRIFLFFLLLIALFSKGSSATNNTNHHELMVIRIEISEIDLPEMGESDRDRNPRPNNPNLQFHSQIGRDSGVDISGCPEQIETFEIWTEDGNSCLLSTDEEKEFLIEFFDLKGRFEVRFLTEIHAFIGDVERL